MKKLLQVAPLILGILAMILMGLYFFITRDAVPVDVDPDARTLYTGYVKIDSFAFADIKTKLEQQGCRPNDFAGETESQCRYRETAIPFEKKNGIEVHPHGFGFGPMSFYLTEDTLWAEKDIPGSPDPSKFKEEVRQDIRDVGGIVQIKENSWKITETKYPWTVVY